MDVQPHFRELRAWFNSHDVDYVIVGAYALAFHESNRAFGRRKDLADLEALGEEDRAT